MERQTFVREPIQAWRLNRLEMFDPSYVISSHLMATHIGAFQKIPPEAMKKGKRLVISSFNGYIWWPRQKVVSMCGHNQSPPVKDCTCGLYSHKLVEELLNNFSYLTSSDQNGYVAIKVAIWGVIIECTKGYRSEFAYPIEMYTQRAHSLGSFHQNVHEPLKDYGVPVYTMDDFREEFRLDLREHYARLAQQQRATVRPWAPRPRITQRQKSVARDRQESSLLKKLLS